MIPFHHAAPLDGAAWPPPALDEGWIWQRKLDGHRASLSPTGVIRRRSGAVVGLAGPLSHMHRTDPTLPLPAERWLDGELLDGAFHAFDLPLVRAPLWERLRYLERLVAWVNSPMVRFVPVLETLDDLHPEDEGVVAKRLDSWYPRGTGACWIKYRRRVGTGAAGARLVRP